MERVPAPPLPHFLWREYSASFPPPVFLPFMGHNHKKMFLVSYFFVGFVLIFKMDFLVSHILSNCVLCPVSC